MKIRRRITKYFKKILEKIPKPSIEVFLITFILILNFILALSVRLIPLRYGIFLTEFDPYFQYYMTQWIVERGWYGFIEWFFQGVEKTMWHPSGRDIPATAYPGVAFIGAFTYLILKSLGINLPLMFVVGLIPPFSAAITSILLYFIGKEIHSKETGLIASFLFAISTVTVGRTVYGFFDDDSISQIYIALFIFSLIKSFKTKSIKWPFVVGLSLGLLSITWGAFIYFLNLFALIIIILILIGRYNEEIGKIYLIGNTIPLVIVALLPKTSTWFLPSHFAFLPVLAYFLIFIKKYFKNIPKIKWLFYSSLTIVAGIIIAYLLNLFGIIRGIYAKFFVVLNPFLKSGNPWIESVGEHAASTWAQFFINFGILFIFLPLGFYLVIKKGTNQDIFLIILGITSIHAAASLNRLFMIAAQPIILIGSIGLISLLTTYFNILKEKKQTFIERKRIKLFKGIPTNYAAGVIILMILLTIFTTHLMTPNPITVSSSPPSILSGETGEIIDDWVATFEWIKNNIPEDAVIASWWDYGYWITVNTGRASVADNANYNFTQIQKIARALVSEEEISLKIFKELNASYVLVYEQFTKIDPTNRWLPIGGDLEKSYWMIRIAFNYDDETVRKLYLNSTVAKISAIQSIRLVLPVGEKGKEALIYKLLFVKIPGVREEYIQEIEDLKIEPPEFFHLTYSSPNGYVLLFEIRYPEKTGTLQ